MTWYTIRNTAADEAEILIYDEIGESFWEEGVTAKAFLEELKAVTAPRINLRINSPGGSVFDGMAIFNALRSHPAQITAHVDGLAASIASIIALSGDRLEMAANSLFMIHNPTGGARGDAAQMRRVADLLDKVRDNMLNVYEARSNLDAATLTAALDAETWYTANEAHAAGFADHVEPAIKAAAHFDLSRFTNAPRMEAPPMPDEPAPAAQTPAPAPAAAAPEPPPAPATTRLDVRPVATAAPMPSLADWIIASGRQDGPRLAELARRIRAAAPHTLLVDIPGLIPNPIVTPVVEMRDGQAPLFNALGPLTAPEGNSFRIPKITTHLADAAAAAEKTDVTAQLVVGDVDVIMQFIKRAANISYEAVQYSQPGIVGIAASDLVDAVLRGAENVTTAGVEAATGTNPPADVAGDGSNAWAILTSAVSTFYQNTGQMPDVFAAAPDVWAKLAGMTNSLGAPLINGVSQTLNGQWGTLFGVPVVVSPSLSFGKGFLLSTYGVKTWASSPVNLQLSQPTTFAYELGGGRNVGVSIADGKFLTPVTIAAGP